VAYKDSGVVFLGVFASKEKDIRKYVKNFNLTYPVGMEDGIADALGVKGVPRTVFIDKEMRIVARLSGPLSYEKIENGINKILVEDLQRQASIETEEISEDC